MMRDFVITKELVLRLVLFGACELPKIGSRVGDQPQSDLIWAEQILTPAEREKLGVPLWTCSGSGNGGGGYGGNGCGCGCGYGYGYCSTLLPNWIEGERELPIKNLM